MGILQLVPGQHVHGLPWWEPHNAAPSPWGVCKAQGLWSSPEPLRGPLSGPLLLILPSFSLTYKHSNSPELRPGFLEFLFLTLPPCCSLSPP